MADFRSLMPWGRGQMMQRGVFDPLSGFRQEMDRLLEDFGRSWPAGGTREGGAATGNFLIPKVDVCVIERTQGSFLRRFALPFEADADHADAQLDKGLLKVMVPRLVTPERQAKKIPLGGTGKGTQH
jgi:HSP20 family protein